MAKFEKTKENYPWLNNSSVLLQLDQEHNKIQYIQLTVVEQQTNEIKGELQGIATSGSLSVNGSSAIRRTGSLNLIAEDTQDVQAITSIENLIYMNKLVFVEVGFENHTNSFINEDILWFPQGMFVMAGASVTKNNSGVNISLTLKDKMCLLNGEHGGTFNTPITHSPVQLEQADGEEPLVEYPLYKTLLYELITEWGRLSENDIASWKNVEVLDEETGETVNKIDWFPDIPEKIDNIVRWIDKDNSIYKIATSENSYELYENEITGAEKFDFGDDIGYRHIDFTYPTDKDLTSQAGETITSVLDKIKNSLGNFEYYFDEFGKFHFEKIKDLQNDSDSASMENLNQALLFNLNNYIIPKEETIKYHFNDSYLISSYSNAPNWSNIKNDLIVWGEDKNEGGAGVVRYHLIIDEKPKAVENETVTVFYYPDLERNIRAYKNDVNSYKARIRYLKIQAEKAQEGLTETKPYEDLIKKYDDILNDNNLSPTSVTLKNDNWRLTAYYQSIVDDMRYFYSKEIVEELPKIIDIETGTMKQETGVISYFIDIIDGSYIDKNENIKYNSFIQSLYVSAIGKRTKSVTDKEVNCVFQPIVPKLFIFLVGEEEGAWRPSDDDRDDPYVQVSQDVWENIAIGTAHNSAYELIRAQLYTLLSFNESVSLSTIPIYYLQPNTLIEVNDADSSISGYYNIKSFNIPLTIEGNMTIQATKAVQRI